MFTQLKLLQLLSHRQHYQTELTIYTQRINEKRIHGYGFLY